MAKTIKVFWNENLEGYIRAEEIKGQYCKVYPLLSPIAKSYSGYRLILKDLEVVKKVLAELRGLKMVETSSIVKQSLSFYAVITYGKCFSEAKGRGCQLNKKDALKYCSLEIKEEHDLIIDQRNKYVAHGELKGYEQNPVVAYLSPDLNNKKIIKIQDNLMSLVDIESQLSNFDILIECVIQYVKEKCDKVGNKLREELLKESLEVIYNNSITVSSDDLIEVKVSQ
ncbi:hypothetical protein RCC89_13165 [Cytophagaceae bacterium ABcell3]|nr:hypothetical protein RCC89_13165 [Cytophagaceae bacterium ABcell3]